MAGTLDYGYLATPTGMLNIAEIVRSILNERKTQTDRVEKVSLD